MTYLWKIVRTLMAVVGIFLIFGGVGTTDYHLLELGQKAPSSVWTMILTGVVLMIPTFVHLIYEGVKNNVLDR